MAVLAARAIPAQIQAKRMPTPLGMIADLLAAAALMACLMAARNPLIARLLPTLPTLPTDLEALGKTTLCAITRRELRWTYYAARWSRRNWTQ